MVAHPTGLFADLYEFTMAQSYLDHGKLGEASFDLHVRRLPSDRGYAVSAGVQHALERLERFRFDGEMLAFLETQGLSEDLLVALEGLRLAEEVEVRGIPEGRLVFPYEPVLEVTGPLPWAQLAETLLLNAVHVGMVVASKAARCVYAAGLGEGGDVSLVDFGARRAHGVDAARQAARAAYLVGFDGTSLVEASRAFGIPCFGTMAHSYVQAFESEMEALDAFASSFPHGTTLLIDTYDTVQGAKRACGVAQRLEERGGSLGGVRIDSGDLDALAGEVRDRLDAAGLDEVSVFASGGLDEARIKGLVEGGAPVDGFGVGSRLVTGLGGVTLDLVYKLVSYEGAPVTKLSKGKRIIPGRKQVYRRRDEDGVLVGDVLAAREDAVDGEALLEPLVAVGDAGGALEAARGRFLEEFDALPDRFKALEDPATFEVRRAASLQEAEKAAIKRARDR